MYWPGPNDYASALMNPTTCFSDPDLVAGIVDYHKAGGIPQTITGNFACIYRVKGRDKAWAIKCFLRNISDQARRYEELENHLKRFCMENTIGFKYLTNGIQVGETFYPIVKMDWLDGDPLDWYIQKNTNHFGTLPDLLKQFRLMVQRLRSAQIAHGDLHHGNIYVTAKGLRLLDYDGSFVPSLAGLPSIELGHPNYQHPGRDQSHFGPDLDNFSAWVIYTSLYCLTFDGSLWHRLAGGDECLLFRSSDFGNTSASYTFSLLESHSSAEIRQAARTLRELCNRAPNEIPPLGESINQSKLPPLRTSAIAPGWAARTEAQSSHASVGSTNYPGFRDYNQAVRFPEVNFDDPELRQAVCMLEDTRIGNNGRVYHFRCDSRDVAVKCFAAEQPNRAERYTAITEFLRGPLAQYVVECEYLQRGILVNENWYPILKMQWVDGMPINELPPARLSEGLISYVADQFLSMALAFNRAGIAHGDLEFGNMLVTGVDLKIVDYDAMFLPSLSRFNSSELGHAAFQHPKRKTSDYAPYLDNFSAWLIHFLLKNMSVNAQLSELTALCLQDERKGTQEHVVLRGLETHPQPVVRQLGTLLRALVLRPLHMIPDIHRDLSLHNLLAKTTKEVTNSAGGSLIHRKPKFKP